MSLSAKFLIGLLMAMCLASRAWGQPPDTDIAIKAGQQIAEAWNTSDGAVVEFLIYAPKNYVADGETRSPLLLFLHGRGESGGGIQRVAIWGPPQMAARGEELPFIVVSPQCPRDDWWGSDTQVGRLSELLDAVCSQHAVDPQRIYLTGLSMGGYGTWAWAAKEPQRFAAINPICGGGDPALAARLKDTPIWAFHGADDRVVPLQKSLDMISAVKDAGNSEVRMTILEHIGHNSWSAAYATPELYSWLLSHKRPRPGE